MSRVVVVEDNAANRKLVRVILEAAGHEVIEAEDAESGIEAVRAHRPDLVLMDVQLPGLDGLEATRRLRADAVTRDIPVVCLTALAMKGDEERILEGGCDGYIPKPIRHRPLLDQLRGYLNP